MSSASPNVECARAVTCQSPVMPGRHEEALEVVGLEVLGLVRDARARADERHVAAQDVDQLRQLVEARLAEPAADARDRVAAVELVERRCASGRGGRAPSTRSMYVAVRRVVGVDPHRPELQRRELALVLAEPRLPEEDRARRVALDPPAR